ncbi:MAG: hypothetical protein QXK57_06420 [Conexivisphaerales archaeon]
MSSDKAVFKSLDESKTASTHLGISLISAMGTFLDGYDISIIGVRNSHDDLYK